MGRLGYPAVGFSPDVVDGVCPLSASNFKANSGHENEIGSALKMEALFSAARISQ